MRISDCSSDVCSSDLPAALLRYLPSAERRTALAIVRQVGWSRVGAAFAHVLPGEPQRRVAHHLYAEDGDISGEIEILPQGEMRLPQERDYLTGLSNRRAAQKWIEIGRAQV